jgi:threonyl-tRNA synthetase
MTYIGSDGEKHRPFMIHRALLGSIERFFGVLIEHYKGAFPVWLMPEQVRILTISENQKDYAENIATKMLENNIRVKINEDDEKLGYKIREAQMDKIPYMLVIGDKEKENNTISIRTRQNKTLTITSLDDFIELVLTKVANKDLTLD